LKNIPGFLKIQKTKQIHINRETQNNVFFQKTTQKAIAIIQQKFIKTLKV